ncbi:PaaI family thioesterase [Desulfuromonas carbonis]|uniref:PaaI family thioesterase n=1 Tax=Desulfuromonas sp. DDH964 TaxID=1823759 RepID=UPI00078E83AC|nr:PaaI family thioesterase [Desulfuromonas sp. DDH964]AMV72585.1 acyl-CoA thioesterase [Desulfuromonas sp. DDH964]
MARMLVDGTLPRQPGSPQFELEGWIDTAPFEDLLGMTIESVGEGAAVLSLPFVVRLAQGGGVLHGGALTALADTAVAMAIKSRLPAGTIFATTELTTRFLAPVASGRVVAHARVRGPEGRSFFGEARVVAEDGREVAHFSSVFRVARGQGIGE